MPERYLRQHALAHRAVDALGADAAAATVRLGRAPASVQLCIRGAVSREFDAAIKRVLGVAPPREANSVAGSDATRILWLGPDEWLAVRPGDDARELEQALDDSLAGRHALVSDVSHSRVILTLEGAGAREVLCKGCGLDLDPVSFSPGRCAQTALARAHMLLHQVSDEPGYHVYVQRSFADYAWRWLCDAAREYRTDGATAD